jgi:hypothetical protein
MLKLLTSVSAICSLLLAGDAFAAAMPPHQPASAAPAAPATQTPTQTPKVDPAKLRDCEQAWARQRVKKGSRKAFIRACVSHG